MFNTDVNEISKMFEEEIKKDILKAVSLQTPSPQLARISDKLIEMGETNILAKQKGLEFLRFTVINTLDLDDIFKSLEEIQNKSEEKWKKMEDKVCG